MSRYLSALKKSESAQMTNLINLKNLPSTKDDKPKEPKKPPFASSLGFLGSSYKDIEKNQASNDTPDKSENITCYRWMIHFKDRNPVTVTFSPEVTHAEALANYPDAVAAEPVGKSSMRRILNAGEEAELRALIEAVFLNDSPDDRNEALQVALTDPDNALACYTAIASERGLIVTDSDDRRFCRQCSNLRGTVCTIAQPGGAISAKKGYTPSLEFPHRCNSFIERNAK